VIVTIVLLKVALTCATPLATLLRTFFFFAIVSPCFSRLAPFAVQSAKSALAFRVALAFGSRLTVCR
jgi:hypothetical protein